MAHIELDPPRLSQRESLLEPQFLFMGLQDYKKAEEWQAIFLREIREGKRGPTILGLEHLPTISLGRRADRDQDVLWSQESLDRQGMKIVSSDRGGQATLHTPGQLVIYPLLDLGWVQLRVKDFVCLLTQVTQATLTRLGIQARSPDPQNPGLFTDRGKIASFGLRVEQGLTSHGLSINSSNELHLFGAIRACGVPGQAHTRILDESGRAFLQKELFELWRQEFLKKWQVHLPFPLTNCEPLS